MYLRADSLSLADDVVPRAEQSPTRAASAALEDGELSRYWCGALAGTATVVELPADRPRTSGAGGASGASGHVPVALPPALVGEVRRCARAEETTELAVLLTAFAVLVARHAGAWDLAIGVPAASVRPEGEAPREDAAELLPVRADLSGGPSFRAALARVHGSLAGARAHAGLPLEQLAEALGVERDPARAPLCQVMFALEPATVEPATVERARPADAAAARCELALELELGAGPGAEPGAGTIAGHAAYAAALFDEATVRRLCERFAHLLAAALADPACEVARLPMVPPAERALLEAFHGPAPVRTERCLHAPVFERAREAPDAIALESGARRMTYGELAAAADHLAHRLQALGVGPEVVVGVWADRSIEAVVAVLGILRAGGAMVPLSPHDPIERIAGNVERAGLRIIVAPPGDPDVATLGVLARVVLLALGGGAAPAEPAVGPDHLAYAIFTSGSTGRPKGVAITHAAVSSALAGMQERLAVRAGDALVTVASLSFDMSIMDMFLALGAGARLVIASAAEAADGALLAALIEQSGATMMMATPTTWRQVVEAGWRPSPPFRAWSGGEPLTRALADALGEPLWNLYGPTEAAICATLERVGPGEPISVGRPHAGARAYVLEPHGEPAPIGVPGELCVGGPVVARGYLGDPEKTAAAFPPDRAAADPTARLFRTGDRARFLPDGRLELLGRMDQQVKLHGYRIELGEIEACLEALPDVRAAVVQLGADAGGAPCLVAHVEPAGGAQPEPSELCRRLRGWLPQHMIPIAIQIVDAWPLLPGGKVDRRALPVIEVPAVAPDSSSDALSSGRERP